MRGFGVVMYMSHIIDICMQDGYLQIFRSLANLSEQGRTCLYNQLVCLDDSMYT
jgi:hypothetical protein